MDDFIFNLTSQCLVDVDLRTVLYIRRAVVNKMLGIVRVMYYRYKLMNLFCVIVLQKIIADFLIHYYAICQKERLKSSRIYLR